MMTTVFETYQPRESFSQESLESLSKHWMKQGALSEAHGKILAGLLLDKQPQLWLSA